MTWKDSADPSSRPTPREGEPVGTSEATASGADPPSTPGESPFLQHQQRKLELLGELLRMRRPVLIPVLSPFAPYGHAVTRADEILGLGPGESLEHLEDLADLGLLSRQLHNQVHVCPACRRCQINFRELCPLCESIDLELEGLIQHFRCAYSGVESEFAHGFELVCPKCRRQLNQLGQDFDRPSKAYVCKECKRVSEEADLRVQCLHCTREFPSAEVEVAKVYRYRPTLLTLRAVELERLTGLDAAEVMFDSPIGLATREFLTLQARRELARLARYGAPFSTVVLSFKTHGSLYPIFREWAAADLRHLGQSVTKSVRNLDLVSRLGNSRIGILLPETNAAGLAAVRRRFQEKLQALALATRAGQPLDLCWADRAWVRPDSALEDVLGFFDGEFDEEIRIHDRDLEAEPGADVATLLDAPYLAGEEPVEPLALGRDDCEEGFDPRGFVEATTAPLDDGDNDEDFLDLETDDSGDLDDVLDVLDGLIERAESDAEEAGEPGEDIGFEHDGPGDEADVFVDAEDTDAGLLEVLDELLDRAEQGPAEDSPDSGVHGQGGGPSSLDRLGALDRDALMDLDKILGGLAENLDEPQDEEPDADPDDDEPGADA